VQASRQDSHHKIVDHERASEELQKLDFNRYSTDVFCESSIINNEIIIKQPINDKSNERGSYALLALIFEQQILSILK